jgi:hypothetical protein
MLRLILLLAAIVALVLATNSCCCRGCGQNIKVPTGDGGSVTFTDGKTVEFTDEKGQKVTIEADEGSGEFSAVAETEEGTTTVTGSESEWVMEGPEGEQMRIGDLDPEVVERIGLPVYPGATGLSSTSMPQMATAAFETTDAYEDVVAFYESELGEQWNKSSFSSSGTKSTSWMTEDSKMVITINGATGTEKTSLTLMREFDSEQ